MAIEFGSEEWADQKNKELFSKRACDLRLKLIDLRLKLIDSAHELIRELGQRTFNVTDRDEQAYDSALEFLQMQYELEKPVVVIREPKEPV